MVFGSRELAARLERVERDMLAEGVGTASGRAPGDRRFLRELAGGVAVWRSPESPMNKVAGLGFGGTVADEDWSAIEAAFRDRGAPVRVELSNLADPTIAVALTRRGYVLAGFENVLGLALAVNAAGPHSLVPDRRDSRSDITIAAVSDDGHADAAWLDTVVDGFAVPDVEGAISGELFPREALERAIRDMTAGAGFTRYLASVDGSVAGGASLRNAEGVAQLTGVTTEPGSRSQRNAQRQGFALLYTRAVLVLEAVPRG
jgi:hypothetical protein